MIVTQALPVATAAAPAAAQRVDDAAAETASAVIAREAGNASVEPAATRPARTESAASAPDTTTEAGDATAIGTAAEGAAVDFSAVIATTSAPARAIPLTIQPATPVQIGAHAPQGPGLGGAFFALLLVLGLILGLAWLLKRLPGSGFRQADGLRVIASINLGAKERAAVVQVGGEQLLLGIGAGGVRTLHVLPQPLPEAAPAQMPTLKNLPDFKQLLAQRLRKDT